MANPIFLNVEQALSILQSELPNGVYASDRADNPNIEKRSYSSSELRTVAQIYSELYNNLQTIYEDKFLTTVQPDALTSWESNLFLTPQDSNLPFATRQANLITKYRATGGISYIYIYNLVASILNPVGLTFALISYSGNPIGAWRLEVSELDLNTYLSEIDPIVGAIAGKYNLDCHFEINTNGDLANGDPTVTGLIEEVTTNIQIGAGIVGTGIPSGTTVLSKSTTSLVMSQNATLTQNSVNIQIQNYIAAGLTASELAEIQTVAYTYAVLIYGNASSEIISSLDQVLTKSEPGGSTHQIFNNVALPIDPNVLDLGGGSGCKLVDSYDCGYGLMGATFNVWDFEILGG